MAKSDTRPKGKSPRTAIATLAFLLKQFKPILVNEKKERVEEGTEGAIWNGAFEPRYPQHELTPHIAPPPTFDQTLNAIGQAMVEIQMFVQEHEQLLESHSNLRAQAMMAGTALSSLPFLAGRSLDDACDVLVGRFRQCYDFIEHVEKTTHDTDLSEAATRFLEPIRKKFSDEFTSKNGAGLHILPPQHSGEESIGGPTNSD